MSCNARGHGYWRCVCAHLHTSTHWEMGPPFFRNCSYCYLAITLYLICLSNTEPLFKDANLDLNFTYPQTPVIEVEPVAASEFEGANGGSTLHDVVLYSLLFQLSTIRWAYERNGECPVWLCHFLMMKFKFIRYIVNCITNSGTYMQPQIDIQHDTLKLTLKHQTVPWILLPQLWKSAKWDNDGCLHLY